MYLYVGTQSEVCLSDRKMAASVDADGKDQDTAGGHGDDEVRYHGYNIRALDTRVHERLCLFQFLSLDDVKDHTNIDMRWDLDPQNINVCKQLFPLRVTICVVVYHLSRPLIGHPPQQSEQKCISNFTARNAPQIEVHREI